MCVAVVVDSKDRIPKKNLEAMHDANPHGAGIAWCDGLKINYRKGLTWQDINKLQDKLPRPFFMHFRIATFGAKVPELTHPFPLGYQAFDNELIGSADGVLMHNGSWSKYRDNIPKGPEIRQRFGKDINPNDVSDTQVAAFWAKWYEHEFLKEVSWSTAVMRATDKPGRVDITLRGRWFNFDGNQYSNEHWKRELTKTTVYYHQNKENWTGWRSYNSYKGDTEHKAPAASPASLVSTPAAARAKTQPITPITTRKKGEWGGEELFTKEALEKASGEITVCDYCGEQCMTAYSVVNDKYQCYLCSLDERVKAAELADLKPSVKCPDCKKEITQIPCECAGMDADDFIVRCQHPKCASINVEQVTDDYWQCNDCNAAFVPEIPFKAKPVKAEDDMFDYGMESMDIISGDRPGDQERINALIKQDGIKLGCDDTWDMPTLDE